MDETSERSSRHVLVNLITSNINMARVFVAISRAAHKLGKIDDSEFARQRAAYFYSEALRSIDELPERESAVLLSDLQNLSTNISWLSMQVVAPAQSSAVKEEDEDSPPKICENSWRKANAL